MAGGTGSSAGTAGNVGLEGIKGGKVAECQGVKVTRYAVYFATLQPKRIYHGH